MKIALNVNRTRITVLGFNLALLFFLTGSLLAVGQHHEVPALWVFLPSFAHIATGFSLTLGSITLLLMSQRFDEAGSVGMLRFSSGELLMYLALGQTVSGGLQLFVGGFVLTFRELPAELVVSPAVASEIAGIGRHLTAWIHALAAIVWFGLTYFAPGTFLARIPLSRRPKVLLSASYVIMMLAVFWISSNAYFAHARARGETVSRVGMFVGQLWQPRLWRDPSLPTVNGTEGSLRGSTSKQEGVHDASP